LRYASHSLASAPNSSVAGSIAIKMNKAKPTNTMTPTTIPQAQSKFSCSVRCASALINRSSGCVCRDICVGKFSVPRVCLGGVGASGSPREGILTDAADDSSSIVHDAGDVCHCDGSVVQVSILGLCARGLCLVCLSASRSFWRTFVKMDSFVSSSYRDSSVSTLRPNRKGDPNDGTHGDNQ
jgi:hypothetical protein